MRCARVRNGSSLPREQVSAVTRIELLAISPIESWYTTWFTSCLQGFRDPTAVTRPNSWAQSESPWTATRWAENSFYSVCVPVRQSNCATLSGEWPTCTSPMIRRSSLPSRTTQSIRSLRVPIVRPDPASGIMRWKQGGTKWHNEIAKQVIKNICKGFSNRDKQWCIGRFCWQYDPSNIVSASWEIVGDHHRADDIYSDSLSRNLWYKK